MHFEVWNSKTQRYDRVETAAEAARRLKDAGRDTAVMVGRDTKRMVYLHQIERLANGPAQAVRTRAGQ